MESSPLERALLRTLAYMATQRFLVSEEELWMWLVSPEKVTPQEVARCCATSCFFREHAREITPGYWALRGVHADSWKNLRQIHLPHARRKWKRAHWAASWLRYVPGVLGVAVGNSLAWNMTSECSDIDLFIVAKKHAVWSVRMWCTLPLILLGLRPGNPTRDPLCLSFFVDETMLDLKIFQESPDDWYLAYWTSSLWWIVADEAFLQRWRSENAWVKGILGNAPCGRVGEICVTPKNRWLPIVGERIFRDIQWRHLPHVLRKKVSRGAGVVMNDSCIKMHVHDTRKAFRSQVRELLAKRHICLREV